MGTRWNSLIVLLSLVVASCGSPQASGQDEDQTPLEPSAIPSQDNQPTSSSNPLPNSTDNLIGTSASTPIQRETTQMPPISSTPVAPDIQDLIEKAKEDLTQRLSIPSDQITIIEARRVIWSNSSLGCPQSGMAYAEVLTPGYLVLLNVNGRNYEYHAGRGPKVFYCENPTPPVPGMPDNT